MKKALNWLVFLVVTVSLAMVAKRAENLIPASFEASRFVASTVEPRDNLYGVAAVGKSVVWMAGTNGKVVRSEDGGASWVLQESGINEHLQDIGAWDKSRAVAVGNEGVVITTQDGGMTWKRAEAPRSDVANKLVRLEVGPDGRAWAVGLMGAVLGTQDYGATWRRLVPETDAAWNGIAFANDRNGWVVGEFGRMMRTADGGVLWEERQPLVESSLMAVAFRDPAHGVAVGLEGVILTTSDAGDTWTLLSDNPTTEHLWEVAWHTVSDRWVAVGNQGTLVLGDREGREWESKRLSDKELLWHTSIAAADSKLYIVGGSQGVLEKEEWHYLF
jgi:photosystem II stability/assembly factor-like uncharacterized protein